MDNVIFEIEKAIRRFQEKQHHYTKPTMILMNFTNWEKLEKENGLIGFNSGLKYKNIDIIRSNDINFDEIRVY